MRRSALILKALICGSCGGTSPASLRVCPQRAGPGDASAISAGLLIGLHARTPVVLPGTGTPNADPARQGPALAAVVKGTPYPVDDQPHDREAA